MRRNERKFDCGGVGYLHKADACGEKAVVPLATRLINGGPPGALIRAGRPISTQLWTVVTVHLDTAIEHKRYAGFAPMAQL